VRLLAAATAIATVLIAGAPAAPAAQIGANDDSAIYEDDGGAALFQQMTALGLRQVVLAARFEPSEPLQIQDEPLLEQAVGNAVAAGLRVVLAVYPYPPRELEAGFATPDLFGAYVASLAEVFPQVTEFIVGNEPNQPAFWRPQFGANGANVSAAEFGPYLAAAYDALKAVNPGIAVVGVGLSPRGNDRPDASDNISTSPVRFLRALGEWYRASGRTRPLMDAFSFHPYPRRATDSLDRGYSWPNAGFANLDRVKQALWDAFHGTAQRTTVDGLQLHLDEVGWQVDTSGFPGYTGLENVPVTDEQTQAAIYRALVLRAACDPEIAEVNFFGFRDDGARTGFQAALERLDGTPRPSAEAVRAAIDEVGARGCGEPRKGWRPTSRVLGARILVGSRSRSRVEVRAIAGEDVQLIACVSRLGRAGALRGRDAVRVPGARCRTEGVRGLRPCQILLPAPAGAARRARVAVELVADSNRGRRTLLVRATSIRR
jgi:hypothetical protein